MRPSVKHIEDRIKYAFYFCLLPCLCISNDFESEGLLDSVEYKKTISASIHEENISSKLCVLESELFINDDEYLLNITNQTEDSLFTLILDNYLVDSIFIYQKLDNNTLKHILDISVSSANIRPVLPIVLAKKQSIEFVIKVSNRPPYSIPISCISTAQYHRDQEFHNSFFGMCIGFFMFSVLLALGGVVTFRKPYYVYFALYNLCTTVFYIIEYGYAHMLGRPAIMFNERLVFSLEALSGIFFLLFNKSFFKSSNRYFEFIVQLLLLGSLTLVLVINTPLLQNNKIFPFIYNSFLILFIGSFLIGLLRLFWIPFKSLFFKALLVLSYTLLIFGIIIKPISFLGYLDYTFLVKYGSIFAQIAEILVLGTFLLWTWLGRVIYTSNLEKEKLKFQISALQAQMNPHFIFNSLNSIQGFIMKNNKEDAMEYLANFAKLIRGNLNASSDSIISLDQEIAMLTNYLSLEKLRFDNSFVYSINCDPELDLQSIMIPPMLIQPFVENAVLHGMKGKQGNGNVQINFEKDNCDAMIISILDNGPGIKNQRPGTHRSHGMRITNKRLKHIYKLLEQDISFSSTENGTKVAFSIPITVS